MLLLVGVASILVDDFDADVDDFDADVDDFVANVDDLLTDGDVLEGVKTSVTPIKMNNFKVGYLKNHLLESNSVEILLIRLDLI